MNRPMMGAFIVAIATIFCATPNTTQASGYGYSTASDGYTWRDGYWWANGVAYTRYTDKCWYNCNRSWYWCYKYLRVEPQPYAATTTNYLTSTTENWRSKLLDIAAARDRYEASARSSALEHNEFMESVKMLGFQGNFGWSGYGYAPNYAKGVDVSGLSPYAASLLQQSGYSQLTAPQGATTYGYTQSADLYGNTDLGAIYNQALRLRDQSRQMEAQGDAGTTQLVDNLGNRAAAIAEIQAKANATAQLIASASQATQAANSATVTNRYSTTTVGPSGPATTQTQTTQTTDPTGTTTTHANNASLALAQATANTYCVSCHGATVKKGSPTLDLSDLSKIPRDTGLLVLERITTRDLNKVMPRNADGTAGAPLNDAQVMQFLNAAVPNR